MNYWAQFIDLLPKTPRYIGNIVSQIGYTYTIARIDGGLIRGTSSVTYEVDTRVFVRNGVIEGSAPNLTLEDIEI